MRRNILLRVLVLAGVLACAIGSLSAATWVDTTPQPGRRSTLHWYVSSDCLSTPIPSSITLDKNTMCWDTGRQHLYRYETTGAAKFSDIKDATATITATLSPTATITSTP